MFVGSWIVLFSFHGGIVGAAIFGLFCVVTNLVPIVLVAALGRIFGLMEQASCWLGWCWART